MSTAAPLVGVVLVNFNGMSFMPECLESLEKLDYPNVVLVLVDNASGDGSREWLEGLSGRHQTVLLPTNTGITGGNNAGIERCLQLGCEEILLLNNDTIVQPDLVSELVLMREAKRLLVPRIYFFDSPGKLNTNFGDFDFNRGISLLRFYGKPDSEEASQSSLGSMASTCALMFPSCLIDEVGLFDETYFMYFDDTDFVARAVRAGYLVKYVPNAKLYHRESSSSGGEALGPLPLYYQTRNRLLFMVKHQENRFRLIFFFVYFSLTRLVYLMKWRIKRDRRSLYAFGAAIRDFRARNFGYAPPSRYRWAAEEQ